VSWYSYVVSWSWVGGCCILPDCDRLGETVRGNLYYIDLSVWKKPSSITLMIVRALGFFQWTDRSSTNSNDEHKRQPDSIASMDVRPFSSEVSKTRRSNMYQWRVVLRCKAQWTRRAWPSEPSYCTSGRLAVRI
jgi:hypothetical protein